MPGGPLFICDLPVDQERERRAQENDRDVYKRQGKTTLIKRLLADALQGEQVVLIENEFGEIGIDGGFLKEAGIVVNEMNAGCICCSLVGDFGKALHEVVDQYHPDRILIEPSGVGKLSDVIAAVQNAHLDVTLNSFVTVVDALKAKMYLKNFGEFFENQVAHAGAILLSRTAECTACLLYTSPGTAMLSAPICCATEDTVRLKPLRRAASVLTATSFS